MKDILCLNGLHECLEVSSVPRRGWSYLVVNFMIAACSQLTLARDRVHSVWREIARLMEDLIIFE